MYGTEQIGPAVRADFRRLYPANAKTPTCCPSDDNRTKVTNSVTSARSLWWHVGPYFWPADLTRTANPITSLEVQTPKTKLNRCLSLERCIMHHAGAARTAGSRRSVAGPGRPNFQAFKLSYFFSVASTFSPGPA